MNTEPPPLPPKKSLALPVILAFVPAASVLLLLTLNKLQKQAALWCIVATIVSIGCCAISSTMLIKRNTSAAIVFGILLGLLNLAITAGLGCAAMLSDFNVH